MPILGKRVRSWTEAGRPHAARAGRTACRQHKGEYGDQLWRPGRYR